MSRRKQPKRGVEEAWLICKKSQGNIVFTDHKRKKFKRIVSGDYLKDNKCRVKILQCDGEVALVVLPTSMCQGFTSIVVKCNQLREME